LGISPGAAPKAQAGREGAEGSSAQRAAARKVFEAKYKETNPRLPFYATIAALCLCGVGYGVYVWWQMRPPAPLVNNNPKPPAGERSEEHTSELQSHLNLVC